MTLNLIHFILSIRSDIYFSVLAAIFAIYLFSTHPFFPRNEPLTAWPIMSEKFHINSTAGTMYMYISVSDSIL